MARDEPAGSRVDCVHGEQGRASKCTIAARLAVCSSYYKHVIHTTSLWAGGREVSLFVDAYGAPVNPFDDSLVERPRVAAFSDAKPVPGGRVRWIIDDLRERTGPLAAPETKRNLALMLAFGFSGWRNDEVISMQWGRIGGRPATVHLHLQVDREGATASSRRGRCPRSSTTPSWPTSRVRDATSRARPATSRTTTTSGARHAPPAAPTSHVLVSWPRTATSAPAAQTASYAGPIAPLLPPRGHAARHHGRGRAGVGKRAGRQVHHSWFAPLIRPRALQGQWQQHQACQRAVGAIRA